MTRFYLVLIFLLICSLSLRAQDNSIPVRHPEQEAKIQTERLKQKVELTAEQELLIYQINLRYAQERQRSNSRAEAMQRIKRKDEELRHVLNEEQYHRMRNEKYNGLGSQALPEEAPAANKESSPTQEQRTDLVPIQSLLKAKTKPDMNDEQVHTEISNEYSRDTNNADLLQKKDSSARKIDTRARTTPSERRRQRLTAPIRSKADERTRRRSLQRNLHSPTIEADSLKTKTENVSSEKSLPQ